MKIIPIEKNYIGVSFGYYHDNKLVHNYQINGIREDEYLLTNLDFIRPSSISIKGFNTGLLNNSIRIIQ